MHRCYCGQSGGSFAGTGSSILKSTSHVSRLQQHQQQQQQQQQPLRADLLSLTSSSRQSMRPTQFVKRPNLERNAELGLGHSKSELSRNFSRRNSATTTYSHCSSCCSSSGCGALQQQQRDSRVKVLSWGAGEHRNSSINNGHCEHTDNRRLYEQRACAVSRIATEGQGQVQGRSTETPSTLPNPTPECNDELQRLQSLQQFRLLNASECFSAQRQDELRLQQAYDRLGVADNVKWQKNKANECRQQTVKPMTSAGPTPYALRQKLLQLRLQEEEANGRGCGAPCAPLERSCALRYN
ncbi:uncharacterized protein [Drosophila virilis]|uniref:Uncharacterized protein n=1 Tax=Drosophila virilis TaxID=7244 RepID=B4LXX9_DROVI|nr:uncharacterized protein LOC6629523 [Drosophila virilis]EDW66845.1 uncharacterized protein Dvir_GJ23402 [Drosophila virilis]